MAKFVNLTNPLAQAIVCLESPHCGPTDVLIFVAAALLMYSRTFKELMQDPIPGLAPPIQEITTILTAHFKELIDSANGHDAYFTALILHPGRSSSAH